MGRRSRWRAQEQGSDSSEIRSPDVHITVATTLPDQEVSLHHEIELVKAALLYADRVTLASPRAALLAQLAGFTALGPERVTATADLLSQLPEAAETMGLYEQLKRKKRLAPPERMLLAELERVLAHVGSKVGADIESMLDEAGAGDLALAIEAGVLDINPLVSPTADSRDFAEQVLDALTDVFSGALSGTDATLPLFDDGAGELLRSLIEEGLVSEATGRRPTEAALAGTLVGRIDAFPDAEMDVVLDVRTKLQTPLTRFRAALVGISAEFSSQPWEPAFNAEVEDLYRKEVAPALQEIREHLDELGARRTLQRLAAEQPIVAGVGATLGLALAAGLGLTDLPAALFGAPAGAGAIAGAAREGLARREVERRAGVNSFYFLYDAARQLRAHPS